MTGRRSSSSTAPRDRAAERIAALEAELGEARRTIGTLKDAISKTEAALAEAVGLRLTVPPGEFACAYVDELLAAQHLDARYLDGEGWTLEQVVEPHREVAADTLRGALGKLGLAAA